MASNQTANFGLNQWEASDSVLRADFNADNVKIDGALATIPKIAAGEYTGNGAATRIIPLDFTPRVVYLCDETGQTYGGEGDLWWRGGLVMAEHPLTYRDVDYLATAENGFRVVYQAIPTYSGSPYSYYLATNQSNIKYRFLAIG